MGESVLFRVNDVKQYAYCPRIPFYTYAMPVEHMVSFKMEAGQVAHEDIERLEARRTLKRYGLSRAERLWKVRIVSERLGLSGQLDLLLLAKAGPIPVDFKWTQGPVQQNHRLQVAAYALLVEEKYGQAVDMAFVYRISEKVPEVVRVDARLRQRVMEAVECMKEMVKTERMPSPTPQRMRCYDCEFQNYCADIW